MLICIDEYWWNNIFNNRNKSPIENYHEIRKKVERIPLESALRAAVLPGWGQIYNQKYWKLPLVYGALGTTTFVFFNNLNNYKDARDAFILATDNIPGNDNQIKQPYFSVKDQPERIKSFRTPNRAY